LYYNISIVLLVITLIYSISVYLKYRIVKKGNMGEEKNTLVNKEYSNKNYFYKLLYLIHFCKLKVPLFLASTSKLIIFFIKL